METKIDFTACCTANVPHCPTFYGLLHEYHNARRECKALAWTDLMNHINNCPACAEWERGEDNDGLRIQQR